MDAVIIVLIYLLYRLGLFFNSMGSFYLRYNLRPMAAHNLALIYRESGNISKATMLLKKYCVIE